MRPKLEFWVDGSKVLIAWHSLVPRVGDHVKLRWNSYGLLLVETVCWDYDNAVVQIGCVEV